MRDTVVDRMPATLLLGGTALLVTVIVAVPIGILAAVKQYSWADKVITTFATIGYAIPSFLLGLYIAYLGTVVFRGLFPGFGMVSLPGVEGRGTPLDVAWHMVLPVTLARDPTDRGLVPLRASQDARGPEPGLRAHRQGQGPERGRRSRSSTPCATRSSRSSPCSD